LFHFLCGGFDEGKQTDSGKENRDKWEETFAVLRKFSIPTRHEKKSCGNESAGPG
jgi:hypothetical protein